MSYSYTTSDSFCPAFAECFGYLDHNRAAGDRLRTSRMALEPSRIVRIEFFFPRPCSSVLDVVAEETPPLRNVVRVTQSLRNSVADSCCATIFKKLPKSRSSDTSGSNLGCDRTTIFARPQCCALAGPTETKTFKAARFHNPTAATALRV